MPKPVSAAHALQKSTWLYRAALLNARHQLAGPARLYPAEPFGATVLLARHLQQTEPGPVRIHHVDRPGEPPLHWVRVGDLHVDWTAPAGPGGTVTVTKSRPARAAGTLGEAWTVPETLDAALSADEQVVLALLNHVNPDVRTQPLLEVVDTWEGHEVLRCGHLMPPGVYERNGRRRCRYCPPVPAARTFRAEGDMAALDWFAGLSDAQRGALIAACFSVHGDPSPSSQTGGSRRAE